MKKYTWMILLLVAVYGVYAYSNKSDSEDVMVKDESVENVMVKDDTMMESTHSGDAMMEEESDADGDAMMSASDLDSNMSVVDYAIDLANFSFSPSLIEVEAGQTIKVKLVNTQGTHDFVIDDLGVSTKIIATGSEEVVEIVIPADASGSEYVFYCSIGNHRALGMTGVLRVK